MTFPVGVELEIDGTWTDVSSRARRVPPTISRGRQDEQSQVAPTSATVVFDNTDGYLSPRNPESPWYPHIGRGLPCRISVEAGDPYLLLSGTLGSRATTPDNAALDIIGDLFIAVELQAPVTLAAQGARLQLAAKYNATGNQRSYYLAVDEYGRLQLLWSTDGTSGGTLVAVSTWTLPLRTAGPIAAGVHLDVNNGAGGRTTRFWGINGGLDELITQLVADETAVRLGDPDIVAATTSIFSSSAPLDIGDIQNTTEDPYLGGIRRLQVRSGDWTGTIAANPDFTAQTAGATGFTDSAGRVWTIQGDAKITDRQTRFVGKTTAINLDWSKARERTGGDPGVATATVEVAGPLRQMQQGDKPLLSTLRRLVMSPSVVDGIIGYWPMEDGKDATRFASPIPGCRPMSFPRAGMTMAADDTLDASQPLPTVDTGSGNIGWSAPVPRTTATTYAVECFVYIPTAAVSPAFTRVINLTTTSFNVEEWRVRVNDTSFNVQGRSVTDTLVVDSTGSIDPSFYDGPTLCRLDLTQNGGNIEWDFTYVPLGTDTGFGGSGSLAGNLGRPKGVGNYTTPPADGFATGHFIVSTGLPLGWLAGADTAWNTETAAHRVSRLCREEGIPITVVGDQTIPEHFRGNLELSAAMGPQRPVTLLTLLQECADTDHGILYENRGSDGLAFRTHKSLQNQDPAVTFDVNLDGLSPPFAPVLDDQRIRNSVTVTREGGSSATVIDQDSVDSEGLYDEDITLNLAWDEQTPDQAGWRLHLGTWPELRLPAVATGMSKAGPGVAAHWLDTDIGDLAVADNLMRQYDKTVRFLVEGYEETLSLFDWTAELNASPADLWEVGIRDDDERGKRDATSVLLNDETTTDTGIALNETFGSVWTTDAGDYPFDLNISGERVTATAAGNAFGFHAFTIIRSVNGVVKTHAAGTEVSLWRPTVRVL